MSKRHKLESEVLKYRNERSLDKLSESLKLISTKYGSSDPVVKLIECDSELEQYLMNHELTSDNIQFAKKSLTGIKDRLSSINNLESKESLFKVPEESSMLLGKVNYAQGNITVALKCYDKFDMEATSQSASPLYMIRLLSEAFAIKGMCIEQEAKGPESKTSKTKSPAYLYELSAQFFFKYLVERERMYPTQQGGNIEDDSIISSVIENGIQRAAMLHFNNKESWKGINLMRHSLKLLHCHTFHIRQTLACKLATVLLRGISKKEYCSDHQDDYPATPFTSFSTSMDKKSESLSFSFGDGGPPFTQPKPKFFLGEKQFHPMSVDQEAILLIRISEAILNMDPVLDMSPVHAGSRENTLLNAEFLYNLLSVALAPLGQFGLFSSCVEKALKYAFDRFHLWQQFALGLFAAGKTERAIQSFAECSRIEQDNLLPNLLAAKACYQHLRPPDYDRGLRYSELAVATLRNNAEAEVEDDSLKCAVYLSLGIGASNKASQSLSGTERCELRMKAVEAFSMAHSADPDNHKPCLFLAIELARSRKIAQAFKKVHQALDSNPEDLDSLHLLALLQISRRQHAEAKSTLRSALLMYPGNLRLLATKCKLELTTDEREEALRSCDEIVRLWGNQAKSGVTNLGASSLNDRMTGDAVSINHSIGGELDAGSTYANSMAPSRWDTAASDLGSYADLQPRLSAAWTVHSQVWLQVAEVYLELNRFDEAEMCVSEANLLYPLAPSVIFMECQCLATMRHLQRGRLHAHRGELHEASVMYNNVLAIEPVHLQAMENQAGILRRLGKRNAAKKLLRDAVAMDLASHTVWQQLAEIFEEEGDTSGAIECTNLAINLEMTSSVIPISVIPMEL